MVIFLLSIVIIIYWNDLFLYFFSFRHLIILLSLLPVFIPSGFLIFFHLSPFFLRLYYLSPCFSSFPSPSSSLLSFPLLTRSSSLLFLLPFPSSFSLLLSSHPFSLFRLHRESQRGHTLDRKRPKAIAGAIKSLTAHWILSPPPRAMLRCPSAGHFLPLILSHSGIYTLLCDQSKLYKRITS